jgi:hypothetical protein
LSLVDPVAYMIVEIGKNRELTTKNTIEMDI